MTVEELIEKLQKHHPKTAVMIKSHDIVFDASDVTTGFYLDNEMDAPEIIDTQDFNRDDYGIPADVELLEVVAIS